MFHGKLKSLLSLALAGADSGFFVSGDKTEITIILSRNLVISVRNDKFANSTRLLSLLLLNFLGFFHQHFQKKNLIYK